MKKIHLTFYYFLVLLYLELVFKITIFGFKGFNLQFFNMVLYLIPISLFLSLITRMFNEKGNKIVSNIIIGFLSFWFSVEFVFKKIFDTFFCLSLVGLADQAAAFAKDAIKLIFLNIYGIVLMFVPLVITIILSKKNLVIKKQSGAHALVMFGMFILSLGLFFLTLNINKNASNSAYELVYKVDNNAMNLEKLGVSLSLAVDFKRVTFGFTESIIPDTPGDKTDKPSTTVDPTYGYNVLNINFDNYINTTTNNTIKNMHQYFKNDTGTQQNEYTGLFKGKNLVFISAESFNTIGVSEELTPTLYKLINNGFVFNNFYTPINLSTIGGEFQILTGLFADLNSLNKYWRPAKNYFPQGIATEFSKLNYKTYAYHNGNASFQDRDKYMKSMGFTNYFGCKTGMEKLINCATWPRSDIDMFDKTMSDYIGTSQPFLAYYMTVSGHSPWSTTGWLYKKYQSQIADLNVSDGAKGYVASVIELDRAVESLINKLTEANILDDTVIVLVADHYPYDNSLGLDAINELSTYERDNIIEINHSSLIIWNNATSKKVVNKVVSQLDVMPTVYNLFGINYDSRLFMGKDALSNELGLAFFSNRSFVTDKGRYYSSSGKFVSNNGEEVSDEYIKSIKNIVSNRISMSKLIMQNNYYKIILGD